MPQKKKKVPVLPIKPGIARQYLTHNFCAVPDDGKVKNGHVLLNYIQNERSATKTIHSIKAKFGICAHLSRVNSLVSRSLNKFKKMTQDNERRKFEEICKAVFYNREDPAADPPNPQSSSIPKLSTPSPDPEHDDDPSTSSAMPSPSVHVCTSPVSDQSPRLRDSVLTPRKKKLKKRLEFAMKSKCAMQSKYRENLKELRLKVNKTPRKVKHLHQTIRRKEATIKHS